MNKRDIISLFSDKEAVAIAQYIIRRILVFIPMLLILTMIIFGLAQAAPGDPFTANIDPTVDPEIYEQQREKYGLNDSLPKQYVTWLGAFVTGDFGESLHFKGRSVKDVISIRVANTLYLSMFALGITILFAIPIGLYSARKPYSFFDYTATTFGFLGLSIPGFFFGLVSIYIFALNLGWFPSQGSVSTSGQQGLTLILDRLHHLVLPGFTLGFAGIATYMRYVRTEVGDILKSDYVRTARAKGMGETSVLYKHTLRNALIPIVTLLGFELGVLLSGAVITEQVFNYPGLGTLFIDSITNRDYPVIMAINLLLGTTIMVGNLVADILYSVVDPRIRYD